MQNFHKISSSDLIGEVIEIILYSIVNIIARKIHHSNGGAGSLVQHEQNGSVLIFLRYGVDRARNTVFGTCFIITTTKQMSL